MFNKTRYRLVLLFSLVFFLLFNGLGAVLYYSTEKRLYAQTDRAMKNEMNGFTFISNRQPGRNFPFRPPQLMTFVQWDAHGNVQFQAPRDGVEEPLLETLKQAGVEGAFVNITVQDSEYRVLTKTVPNGRLQIAYNLEPERNVLHNLLFLIGTGSLVSLLIAVMTGLFLASRALVPIQKAWEQQQQFVSDASHELRTPLSVLQLHLERLFRHPERTVEQESAKIAVMIDETKRMSKMVGDLLTLARSDSHQFQLQYTKVELAGMIVKVANEFEDLCRLKGIRLRTYTPEALSMTGDPDYLHQLLVIVLDNALKYTHKGSISLRTETDGSYVTIEIADTGIGIKKEDLPHVFDRFYRADKARRRSDGGVGLGLSIAKWIVEAHHGSIRAESNEGQGTVIQMRFPCEWNPKLLKKRRRIFQS
ncbi:cell wall metabolism sensor histidine kinase WalK [Paenibacillus sp. tmac-D7]|uniref:sensor histidine kinase n=1 Tax=Paenibacillus sp. tmac-D7 TaxID=2591462 RepID=UPI001144DDAE|nr:HAMP domain-containing sensor histidine kinase [Paenibacillus sp. tmac-D7]